MNDDEPQNDEIQDIEVGTRGIDSGMPTDSFFVRGCSLKDAVLVAQTLCELRGEIIIAIYVQ